MYFLHCRPRRASASQRTQQARVISLLSTLTRCCQLSSTTTKLRVVFDASAKTTSGFTLNDILLPGPGLYPLLTDVVLAFRTHVIGMSADISKMFREVELYQDDRDLHHFLQAAPRGGGRHGQDKSNVWNDLLTISG